MRSECGSAIRRLHFAEKLDSSYPLALARPYLGVEGKELVFEAQGVCRPRQASSARSSSGTGNGSSSPRARNASGSRRRRFGETGDRRAAPARSRTSWRCCSTRSASSARLVVQPGVRTEVHCRARSGPERRSARSPICTGPRLQHLIEAAVRYGASSAASRPPRDNRRRIEIDALTLAVADSLFASSSTRKHSSGLGKALAIARRHVIHPGHYAPASRRVPVPATVDPDWIPVVAQRNLILIAR